MHSQRELVSHLQRRGILKTERIIRVLLETDRKLYCTKQSSQAYEDSPLGINYGATISAPHMHAYCLEILKHKLQPGAKVLDVGSGSGYLTACMARLVSPTGKVVGIDHIQELVDFSINNILNDDPQMIHSKLVEMYVADGRHGFPLHAPYDCIHVGAATPTTPQLFIDQLKVGGMLVLPEGPEGGSQSLVSYEKMEGGKVVKNILFGVTYVPLTDRAHQLNR